MRVTANESDTAGLTRPEHRSYRTFYWRVALMIPGVVDGDAGRREDLFSGFRIDRSQCR